MNMFVFKKNIEKLFVISTLLFMRRKSENKVSRLGDLRY